MQRWEGREGLIRIWFYSHSFIEYNSFLLFFFFNPFSFLQTLLSHLLLSTKPKLWPNSYFLFRLFPQISSFCFVFCFLFFPLGVAACLNLLIAINFNFTDSTLCLSQRGSAWRSGEAHSLFLYSGSTLYIFQIRIWSFFSFYFICNIILSVLLACSLTL